MKNMKLVAGSGVSKARYMFSATVTSNTSDALLVENTGDIVAVSVQPGTSARVEYTLSNVNAVVNGSATWLVWPHGDVTENVADGVTSKVTALRLVSEGASFWEVVV